MRTEGAPGTLVRPPLRTFIVRVVTDIVIHGTDGMHSVAGKHIEEHEIVAHLVFDNSERGEGLVFRRYYDNDVRTEKVAQFNNWEFYKEKPNV